MPQHGNIDASFGWVLVLTSSVSGLCFAAVGHRLTGNLPVGVFCFFLGAVTTSMVVTLIKALSIIWRRRNTFQANAGPSALCPPPGHAPAKIQTQPASPLS